MYSGDPIRDHEEREREAQAWLDSLPVCCECGEPIQDDECYEFDGELICPDCLKENHRKHTENYID
jgi:formylmethanofuran dehydrogenase subunit E